MIIDRALIVPRMHRYDDVVTYDLRLVRFESAMFRNKIPLSMICNLNCRYCFTLESASVLHAILRPENSIARLRFDIDVAREKFVALEGIGVVCTDALIAF